MVKPLLLFLCLITCYAKAQEAFERFNIDSISFYYTFNKDTISGKFDSLKNGTGTINQYRKVKYKRLQKKIVSSSKNEFENVYEINYYGKRGHLVVNP